MKKLFLLLVLVGLGLLGWTIFQRLQEPAQAGGRGERGPAPVEVARVTVEPLELRRTFSGTLEPRAELVVAPKVGGQLRFLSVDIGDTVHFGQLVAGLDDAELLQEIASHRADSLVAAANLYEARSALTIAARELARVESMRVRGAASETVVDAARADHLAQEARVEVATAHVARAAALLEGTRIRLGYTRVRAEWSGDLQPRLVGERYVDPGTIVPAQRALLSVVELDPITGVIFVTEKDYRFLRVGQAARVTTDAFPGEVFVATIARIAPVFQANSRQARVELAIPNQGWRLKPGMFIRASVVLERVEQAVVVPERALTRRDDVVGVFLVDEAALTVRWRPVEVGIRDGDRVEVVGDPLEGRVVTLGQQLVDDGAPITIPGDADREGTR